MGPWATFAEPARVEAGEQRAGIAVAEIGLLRRGVVEPMKREQGDAARAIAAAREPDGVDGCIVRDFEERVGALLVGAGEMARGAETLRMEARVESSG